MSPLYHGIYNLGCFLVVQYMQKALKRINFYIFLNKNFDWCVVSLVPS